VSETETETETERRREKEREGGERESPAPGQFWAFEAGDLVAVLRSDSRFRVGRCEREIEREREGRVFFFFEKREKRATCRYVGRLPRTDESGRQVPAEVVEVSPAAAPGGRAQERHYRGTGELYAVEGLTPPRPALSE
jgi:hypothetical protein